MSTDRLRKIADAARRLRLLEERARQQGPGGLMHFVRCMWSALEPGREFIEGWPINAIAEHLEAVERGEINRLLVTVSPGFMKSLMINVMFPCWVWGPQNRPNARGLSFSYAAHLTERDNEKCRTLINSKVYQELWGDRFKLASDSKIKISNDHQGWLLASSVGGISTGERADILRCLPAGELISTDNGLIPIEEIVNRKLDVKVYGYNHRTNSVQLQNILEYEKNNQSEIVELQWDGGSLRCTTEHPIFIIGKGYIPASEVKEGDQAITNHGGVSILPERIQLQGESQRAQKVLQSSLPIRAQSQKGTRSQQQAVCHLWQNDLYDTSSLGSTQRCTSSLRPGMFFALEQGAEQSGVEWWQGRKNLPEMWENFFLQPRGGKKKNLLLNKLPRKGDVGEREGVLRFAGRKAMQVLRESFQAAHCEGTALLSSLCERYARSAYGRKREWPLCSRGGPASVSSGVDQDIQGANPETRWELLPSMRASAGAGSKARCSSYRLRQKKSEPIQFNNTVQMVSWPNARKAIVSPVLQSTVIKSVNRLPDESRAVYNLRVGPDHNYFANGLLTHNCDDPHNAIQGESERVRNETVRWFKESMSNRLNDMKKSSIIVVHQRLHEMDVAGSIMEEPDGMGYEHLCIPMEYETESPFKTYSTIGWKDPRTKDGELAWPERFPKDECDKLKSILGPFGWSSQYMQNPEPRGGGIIKRNWWRLWESPTNKFPVCEYIIAALDPAYTEKQENDPSAMTVYGIFRHPETNEPGIILMHAWRRRLPIHGDTSPMFPGETHKAYEKRCGDQWGLVEWVANTCDMYKTHNLLIESKASGISVFQEIERRQVYRTWATELVDTGRLDKVARAYSIQGIFSQGLVWAPDRDFANMVIDECSAFPKARHEDLVDCTTMTLRRLREMGLLQFQDEREYEEYEHNNTPQVTQALYPV